MCQHKAVRACAGAAAEEGGQHCCAAAGQRVCGERLPAHAHAQGQPEEAGPGAIQGRALQWGQDHRPAGMCTSCLPSRTHAMLSVRHCSRQQLAAESSLSGKETSCLYSRRDSLSSCCKLVRRAKCRIYAKPCCYCWAQQSESHCSSCMYRMSLPICHHVYAGHARLPFLAFSGQMMLCVRRTEMS